METFSVLLAPCEGNSHSTGQVKYYLVTEVPVMHNIIFHSFRECRNGLIHVYMFCKLISNTTFLEIYGCYCDLPFVNVNSFNNLLGSS